MRVLLELGIRAGLLTAHQQINAAGQQQPTTGNFMKWFFPIFSVWICLSSTAAFAAYWVFVNLWSIVTNFAINKYLDAKTAPIVDTEKEAIQP